MKLVCCGVVLAIALAPASAQETRLVSENLGGGTPTGGAFWPSLSSAGQFVVFDSGGTQLVPVDANGPVGDVFVRDMQSGVTELVSLSSSGIQANGVSYFGRITPDARFVCFVSAANNLVNPSDPDAYDDVFLRDRVNGTTVKVSLSNGGAAPDAESGNCDLSDDGSRIVFASSAANLVGGDANGAQDIFLRDLAAGTTLLVSRGLGGGSGNGESFQPHISGDGRWVVFGSEASDLVAGDTNGQYDVFRFDLQAGSLERVSESSTGQQGNGFSDFPAISGDGRIVIFRSSATNLVPGDTNGWPDLFAHDALLGTTEVIKAQSGALGNWASFQGAISDDGRYVAIQTTATNLTMPPTFMPGCMALLDRQTGAIQATSFSSCNVPLDQLVMPEISPDGSIVAFASFAAHAVPDDVNNQYDVFVHDPAGPASAPPCAYCVSAPTSNGCLPSISASGTPSVTAASGFVLTVTGVEGQRNGLFIHGSDSITTPWGINGPSYLCVFNQGRFGFQDSLGTAGQCDGVMTFDWNALETWPQPGQTVMAQAWFRDPPSQKGTHMSNAISFIAGP